MTTIDTTSLGRAARVHVIAWPGTFAWTWGVLAVAFAANLVLFAGMDEDDGANTYALSSIYIVAMIAAVQTITQMFSFQVGFGGSRRAFYVSAIGQLALMSLLFAVGLLVLSAIERATDGWGIQLDFFYLGGLRADGAAAQLLVYFGPFLLVGSLGFLVGSVSKRWGNSGTMVLVMVAVVGSAAVLAWIGWTDSWTAVGNWFEDQSAAMLWGAWPAVVALPLLAATWAVLRRTTP